LSLRSRILGLYLALAMAPMMALGVGSYIQSMRAVSVLVETRLQAASEQAASEIRGRLGSLRTSLRFIADYKAPTTDEAADGQAALWRLLAETFERVEFLDAAGEPGTVLRSDARPERSPCSTEPGRLVPIRLTRRGGDVVGWVPATELLSGSALDARFGPTGRAFVFDRSTGSLLYEGGCDEGGPVAPTDADGHAVAWGDMPRGSVAQLSHGAETLSGVSADVDELGWVVVMAAQPGDFIAPYQQMQRLYLGFVLFIALAAGGAFLILAQHFMGSLEELTVAAERIGEGDLSPWLPPPAADEVGRLSNAFGNMLARLKATMRQSQAVWQAAAVGGVAAQLSHEIRNPLSSIRLNLQSVERELAKGKVPADLQEVVEVCLREIERLNDAVSGVLEFGRPKPPERRPCRLGEVVEESLALIRPRLERSCIEVRWEPGGVPDRIMGEASLLRGVFLNLFLNAADAMAGGGGVLRVWMEEDRGSGEVVVHVADEGPGIRPELRSQIFEPFFTTKADGTGIGLPIALQTVEAHGGRLYFEKRSELEHGAEFVVVLPLSEISGLELHQSVRPPRRGARAPDGQETPEAVA